MAMTQQEKDEAMALLERLVSVPTTSYCEHSVLAEIEGILRSEGIETERDTWGNLHASLRGPASEPGWVLAAHTDHPGLLVTEAEGTKARARWFGRVYHEFFRDARFHLYRPDARDSSRRIEASLIEIEETDERDVPVRLLLEAAQAVEPGTVGAFAVAAFKRRGEELSMRAADDLAGSAAVVATLIRLRRKHGKAPVDGLFTRAEESGLVGTAALAKAERMDRRFRFVVLETSKEMPCGRFGGGIVIRVGDRSAVYDPDLNAHILERAKDLEKENEEFHYQRCLMDGGVCEASAWLAFGYRATGLAMPLRNYHNMGPNGYAPEQIHEGDYLGAIQLMEALAATPPPKASDPLPGVRDRLLARLDRMKDWLERSARGNPVLG